MSSSYLCMTHFTFQHCKPADFYAPQAALRCTHRKLANSCNFSAKQTIDVVPSRAVLLATNICASQLLARTLVSLCACVQCCNVFAASGQTVASLWTYDFRSQLAALVLPCMCMCVFTCIYALAFASFATASASVAFYLRLFLQYFLHFIAVCALFSFSICLRLCLHCSVLLLAQAATVFFSALWHHAYMDITAGSESGFFAVFLRLLFARSVCFFFIIFILLLIFASNLPLFQ